MKILLLIAFFLLAGAFFIISDNRIILSSPGEISRFLNLYENWLGNIFESSKTIVGNVINMKINLV